MNIFLLVFSPCAVFQDYLYYFAVIPLYSARRMFWRGFFRLVIIELALILHHTHVRLCLQHVFGSCIKKLQSADYGGMDALIALAELNLYGHGGM